MKLSSQNHILFSKVFLTRNIVNPPGKYPWQELFKYPQVLIFFLIPPFQNLGMKVVLPAERGDWHCDLFWCFCCWLWKSIHWLRFLRISKASWRIPWLCSFLVKMQPFSLRRYWKITIFIGVFPNDRSTFYWSIPIILAGTRC